MNDMNDAPPPSYGANDDGPPPPKYEDVHDTNGEYSYYFLTSLKIFKKAKLIVTRSCIYECAKNTLTTP